jgi:hypothetical protein
MPKEFLTINQIDKGDKIAKEVLDSPNKISVPEEEKENIKEKETPSSLYSQEMDEEIKDLGIAKSFSMELARAARDISGYQLPRIDSFLISLEKENPEEFKILSEKRKIIGKLIKKIFKWEQISRRRDFLKEAKENEKNRYTKLEEKTKPQEKERKTIKLPDGHDLAA